MTGLAEQPAIITPQSATTNDTNFHAKCCDIIGCGEKEKRRFEKSKRLMRKGLASDERLLLFLYGNDSVFAGFCHSEFYNFFGRDFNSFPCLWVTTSTSLTSDQNQLANSRKGKSILGMLIRKLRKLFQDFSSGFFCQTVFFGDGCRDL